MVSLRFSRAAAAFAFVAGCQSAEPVSPLQASIRIVPYDDAILSPMNPANPGGPAIAVLKGDPATGPSDMLMRLPRGPIPMHVHTHDYALTVIDGQIKHWGANGTADSAAPLGAGSYWFQPGGIAHAHDCLSETCLLFIHWSGPQDARAVEAG